MSKLASVWLFIEERTGVVLLTRHGPYLSSHTSNIFHDTVHDLLAQFPTPISLRVGVGESPSGSAKLFINRATGEFIL